MLTSLHLNKKSREVCIKAKSPPASLAFIGQITEHTTVKWPIPAVPIPPGQPQGICLRCQSRGWGIRNFIAARGLGICVPRGDPRAFDTRVFESAMDEFIGKDEAFVEQWLVRQGLEKLVDVFKGMFCQF